MGLIMRRFMTITAFAFAIVFTGFMTACRPSDGETISGEAPIPGAVKTWNVLPIPPSLEDLNADAGVAEFELVARESESFFFDGVETPTYGYNGSYLGPVIRVRRGDDVTIKVKNELGEETTVHWHGLLVPGEFDGGPHQVIEPGAEWEPHFTIEQPAATLWYHPHPHGNTGRQVYMGLAGLFIIDDAVSDSLDIPKKYGVNDIPLIIQDRRFVADGSFEYKTDMADMMQGMLGDTILVNGAVNTYLDVPAENVRFRILNGSNARTYKLSLSDSREFYQIASDSGFLSEPVMMKTLRLSPGERAEIIVDFSPYETGERITLVSPGFEIVEFRVIEGVEDTTTIPELLTVVEKTPESDAEITRSVELTGMGPNVSINGLKFDMDRIDEFVELGATEIWEIRNLSTMMGHGMAGRGMHGGRGGMMGRRGSGMMGAVAHPFHIHGVRFQLLDRDGRPPPANERGWKDTILIEPGETVRVIARFDYPGIFVYHCHILEHEDDGMMAQCEVK
jgi:blue copper oxidase